MEGTVQAGARRKCDKVPSSRMMPTNSGGGVGGNVKTHHVTNDIHKAQ